MLLGSGRSAGAQSSALGKGPVSPGGDGGGMGRFHDPLARLYTTGHCVGSIKSGQPQPVRGSVARACIPICVTTAQSISLSRTLRPK